MAFEGIVGEVIIELPGQDEAVTDVAAVAGLMGFDGVAVFAKPFYIEGLEIVWVVGVKREG